MTSTTDPALKTTAFEYNARSQQTAVVDAISQRYEFVYDALGHRTQEKKGTATMSFVYDAVGNRRQRTDYNSAVTNYAYDALNRMTTISYPDTTSATYGYDALSRLSTAANPTGTVTIAYDNRGRVNSVTDVFGQIVSYAYDANSNRTQLSLNAATSATYQYDVLNRLTLLTDSASLNTMFSYDATNKLTSRTLPNAVSTAYQYDGLDRLTRLTHSKAGNTLADFQYQLNAVNSVTQMGDGAGTHNYTYDIRDRLTAATHPNQTNEIYAFDDVGNRTASYQGSSYSYQAFNRLVTANSNTYAYDANGNLTSKIDASGSWIYSWDYENRLKQANRFGGVTVSYAYDALGRRVQSTSSAGAITKFVYDGADVVRDLDGSGATIVDYLNGPGIDNKLRQTIGGVASYFVTDHLGSTKALADASGNVSSSLGYDSYGNVSSGSAATRYTYTGREIDSDVGLIFYRARWYDPQQGRFISEDPIGFQGGMNFYGFVENSPVNYIDPWGLRSCKEILKDVWNAFNELNGRANDLTSDPQGLQWSHWSKSTPHPRYGSVQGHQEQYEGWRQRLGNLLEEWKRHCMGKGGPPPPPSCWSMRRGPLPEPVRRPNPAMQPPRWLPGQSPEELRLQAESAQQMYEFWKKIAIGGYLVSGVLTGGALFGGTAAGGLVPALAP